jgi:hypothetical protein
MTPQVFSLTQTIELLGGKEVVTEYWLKKTARRLGIGTRFGKKLCFTEAQIKELIDAHALEAKQPKPQNQPRAKQSRAPKPKQLPAVSGTVTKLQARPDRARSYGSAS